MPTVAPTTAPRPSGSPEPRASSAATPSPRPTAPQPSVALFANSSNNNGVAEFNAANGVPIETFGTAYSGGFVSVDDAENIYLSPNFNGFSGLEFATALPIYKLGLGGTTALATLTPTAPVSLTFVAPTGEVVSQVLTSNSSGEITDIAVDEWDPGANGAPSRVFDYGTTGEFFLTVGPDGTVYVPHVANTGYNSNTKIDVIAPDSSSIERTMTETLAPSTGGFSPNWMSAAADGTLYIGEWSFYNPDPDAGLYVFSSTGTEKLVTSMDPGINGLALDASGNVYMLSNNSGISNGEFGADTAQQFSVYSPHATSLLRQFQDNVPGLDSLTVGNDGTAYAIQFLGLAQNAPAISGAAYAAVYKVPAGSSEMADFLPRSIALELSLYSNGSASSFARGRDASAAGSGHSGVAAMGISGRERALLLRDVRSFARRGFTASSSL
jgi:hypothetical protein